jgi:hypothetical protein
VGRFERINEDFAQVSNKLGLDLVLPHENATAHRDYRTYYDDRTAALVAEAFAEDIDRFGYSFDQG